MKYKILIIGFFIIFSSVLVFARQTTTEIGNWLRLKEGSMSFSVIEKNGNKQATMFITDKHAIRNIFFYVSKADLKKIKSLIDETIQELEVDSDKK